MTFKTPEDKVKFESQTPVVTFNNIIYSGEDEIDDGSGSGSGSKPGSGSGGSSGNGVKIDKVKHL